MSSGPIVLSATIAAPIERCFALSTRVELVQQTLGVKLVGDTDDPTLVTSGFITAHSRVHWRGWKFGLRTEHHTLITAFAPPHPGSVGDLFAQYDGQAVAWFEDSQEQGRFATFRHEHLFREHDQHTYLEDRIHFTLPFGPLGRLAAKFLLAPHIRKLARQRYALIKTLAEGEGWRKYIDGSTSNP
jgi:hypothetical protein